MKRQAFLAFLGAAVLSVGLSACTSLAPVYGDHAGANASNIRFNFAPPSTRLDQLVLNRLAVAFPGPAQPGDPVLSVSTSSSGSYTGMSKVPEGSALVGTRVEATVTVTQGEATLFSATRFTDTAYQSGKLAINDAASAAGAQETAARSTAESLRAAILAGYRPGMAGLSTPQR